MSDSYNRKEECERMLKQIQELEFAAVDLNLYLDNHPHCLKAIEDYNRISQDLMNMKKKYEMEFGPLTNFGGSFSKAPWAWIDEPWPWEL